MKKYLILTAILSLVFIFMIGCPTQSGKSGGGDSGVGGTLSVNTTTTDGTTVTDGTTTEGTSTTDTTTTDGTTSGSTSGGTGTVSGTVNDDATVTITQSDGTTQSDTTTQNDPDFIFEDVPEGEATVTVNTGDGETTSQDIEVVEGETTEVNPFGSTQEMDKSLTAHVYEVDEIYKTSWWGSKTLDWSTSTDNINTDKSLGIDFYSKEINVPEREFSEGFPGITDIFEFFGVIYNGTLKPKASGVYIFKITCDDGVEIKINGNVLNLVPVDSNNEYLAKAVHPVKTYTATINMTADTEYSFELKYFQGPKYEIACVLEVQAPGESMKLFDMDDF